MVKRVSRADQKRKINTIISGNRSENPSRPKVEFLHRLMPHNGTLADSVSERAHVRCLVAAPVKTLGGIIAPEGAAWQAILMRQLRKIRIRAARVGQQRSTKVSQESLGVKCEMKIVQC